MQRITNDLFESIRKITSTEVQQLSEESQTLDEKKKMEKEEPEEKMEKEEGESMKEALVGKQAVLDKNKNNKLDKEDFKILRGEKSMKEEEEKEDVALVEGEHSWIHGNLKKVSSVARREKLLGSGGLKQATGYKQGSPATKDSIKDPKIVHYYDVRGNVGSHVHVAEEIEESVSETIIKHDDFVIEVTNNPTVGDFLKALQTIVPVQEEADQAEVVAAAMEAFDEQNVDVIIEAFTRSEIGEKIAAHKKAGNLVAGEKFSVKDGKPYAEYVVTDKEGNRKKYIHHGTTRRMESMPASKTK